MTSAAVNSFLRNNLWKLFLSVSLLWLCNCQDIVFPDDEETSHLSGNKVAITDRVPLHSPNKCPENMLLYPGGGDKSVWVCDCRPKFLYFPQNHTCHEAYRQGPCHYGEYVVLPRDEVVPKCVKNPCHKDGLVAFNGSCYNLRTMGGPCEPAVLDVNETTYQLECTQVDIAPFIVIDVPQVDPCPAGSRRNALGICRNPES